MTLTATVGREAELDSIQAFVDAVPRGPSALTISGEAGIGKTILWEAGVESARDHGFRVLMCRGIEAEASLSFAALSDLVTPVFEHVAPALTPPRRRALEVALLLADAEGSTPDRLAIGLAVLDTLRALSAIGPCVVALDDVQWIDASSAMALQIALKRLTSEPIGVLVTVRDSPGTPLPIDLGHCFVDSTHSVRVGPISLSPLHHLLRDRLSLELSRPELERLHASTDGNPFFALEVGREMVRTDTRSTRAGGLRVPDSLRELVGGRLARLPTHTGDVLLEMAALARPTIDVLVAAHGDREAVLKALDVAERAGVVRLDDSRIRFAHPLHASICYQQAPVWKRQAVHRALAYAVSDLEERALHLARAADGDDADVAAALEAAAEGAGARGAPAAGAELCELAVALTPALLAAESRRRMKQAAIFHRLSGDVERSISLLEVLRSEIPGGPDKADVLVELCETRRFSLPAVLGLCEEALAEAAGDDGRSARVRLTRTQSLLMNGAVGPALEDARAALVLGELIQDPEVIAMAIARIGHAETYGAAVTPGLTERGIEVERGLQGGLQYLDSPRASHARQAMRIGNLEESRFLLEELASAATERGDERTHAQTLGSLALVEWFAGRWNIALAHAREAYESMEQTGEGHGAGASGRTQALIEADLGLVDRARARAEEGVAASREMSDDFFEISALGVLGRLELMLGNAEAASVLLRPLPQRLIDLGINDPTVPVWPDALEALAAVGDLAAARVWLDRWDKQARLIGSPWGMATAERCRGLILAADGDFARAAEAFEDALRVLEGYGYPLERGRTLLCMGSVLRQAQQRAAARDALEQAIAIFDELGGRLWAERARAELARISGRRAPSEVLTGTERQVAELAGAGESNKEIAASLHLGVSTVEAHLSSVYRKLNAKRAELASKLSELTT